MKWQLIHQSFNLCFFRSTKTFKKTCLDGKTITSLDTVELTGITLDKNNNFKWHIQNVYHKENNKIKALFRMRKFLNFEQAQLLAEAYISDAFQMLSTDLNVLGQNE